MRIADIYGIRDRSEAWKSYKSRGTSCPWVTDEEQMILKTVVKQAAKYWPRRERLDAAIDHVNTEGEEGINFAAQRQPERDITPAEAGTIKEINDVLIAMNKTWDDDLLPLCSRIFRRDIRESSDLTQAEAVKALGFLKQKAAA
ncbi:RecT protein [Klebsiella grimontii]|nr:RecT protein [Klebsiella grimontii]